MILEIHVTVNSSDFENFKKICDARQISPLWIENSQGVFSRQMLCALSLNATLSQSKFRMREISQRFSEAGFKVIREKIGCSIGKAQTRGVYHECHIKIILPESETEHVLGFCAEKKISASWSLIHGVPKERKWYLTVRDYKSSATKAKRIFLETLAAVRTEFGKVRGMEMETALLDTNKDLDKGWA